MTTISALKMTTTSAQNDDDFRSGRFLFRMISAQNDDVFNDEMTTFSMTNDFSRYTCASPGS